MSGARRQMRAKHARRRRVSVASAVALVLMLATSVAAALVTRALVRDQESRLLKERAAEVGLVFTSRLSTVTNSLMADLDVLQETGATQPAFDRAVAADVTRSAASQLTIALVRPGPGAGYRVIVAKGPLLKTGQVLSGDRAAAIAKARTAKLPVPTRVLGEGADRAVGFSLAAPGIPGRAEGDVLYRETALGRLSPPRQAATAPFHELNVVLYATPQVDSAQLLVSTSGGSLPARGTRFIEQPAGTDEWLLGVRAKNSLVGSVAANAWWTALAVGIAGALLLAAVIEFAIRRRDAALSLYAAEHQQAETLQRSLLPSLPVLPGLELAARYQAGSAGQQVGGDWFDAFPLTTGGVGLAIGDVIGHDMQAAAAMSQVRAALRAYAYEGDEPAVVVSRLDRFVSTFELAQLVSVVYAVLGPFGDDGSRTLRFANAGHLPPMLKNPDGTVDVLTEGSSVVIGAAFFEPRGQAERILAVGSTLLLFTDGLLEAPDLSLSETIPELAEAVAAHDPLAGCDALCERVLAARPNKTQRDDIALLAVRLTPVALKTGPPPDASLRLRK